MLNTVKQLREFICFNQKELIQYEYLVSQKHKNLREHIESSKNVGNLVTENLIKELLTEGYQSLLLILKNNTSLINKLFESIGIMEEPRITIKTLTGGDNVLDFFRSYSDEILSSSKLGDNSGFSEIMDSSDIMSFLRNNLEKDFLDNNYYNHRLDDTLKEALKNKEISWEECWSPINEKSEMINSYRSTLIIPMSIKISKNDNDKFLDKFFLKIKENNRTIWGFLCFDYPEKDMFLNKEIVIKDIGYIIADILSLYLMFFHDHTSGSNTFKKATSSSSPTSNKA